MWKSVLASEVQEEEQQEEEEENCMGAPADPITAIHEEEEEEQASKEEDSTDGLDEAEMRPALEEEESPSLRDTSGENEAWNEPGMWTLSGSDYIYTRDIVASTSLWHDTVDDILGKMCLTNTGCEDRDNGERWSDCEIQ